MQIDLSGKVAVVTGGSRGLGRADALALAKAGADVVILDLLVESETEQEKEDAAGKYGMLTAVMAQTGVVYAEKTSADIRAMGRKSLAIKVDVTDRARVFEVFEQINEEFGGVHILINNAATLDHTAQVADQVFELWMRDLNVNLTGAFNCTQAAWPHMKTAGYGRVINMSSIAGTNGGFGQLSYSTTKSGMVGFTKTLALEGARHGITSNCIVPGVIRSEAFKMSEQTNSKMTDRMIERTAFKKAGEPDDIANAITFLCSEQASYITGVTLPVNGGMDLFVF
ncbi:MAG: SDR family oxidoreductase [Thermoleophilia bacterium]|nr:SDR family oxidoreductase [Thermoleophilia bacterium]